MDDSPFNVTGFVAPGRAYRLLSLGLTPPTPLGAGRQTQNTIELSLFGQTEASASLSGTGTVSS